MMGQTKHIDVTSNGGGEFFKESALSAERVEKTTPTASSQSARRCVVFACDETYAMPLATAMLSLAEAYQGDQPLDIYVLFNRFREAIQQRVVSPISGTKASIQWIFIDLDEFESFSTLAYTSRMTYARLKIADLLPRGISRALYLDADILVLDDVERIFETELNGSILGAITDGLDAKLKAGHRDVEGVPRVHDYFNAGVLLIDLNLWREKLISNKVLRYLEDYPRSGYADQDALNVVCDLQWKQLESRWNYQECWKNNIAEIPCLQRPGIVHFVTAEKPWHAGINHINAKFYDSFRKRTCFTRSAPNRLLDKCRDMSYKVKCNVKKYVLPQAICKPTRSS